MGRASKHKKSKKNKGMVILVVVLLIIILAAGVVLYMKYKNSNNKEGQDVAQEPEEDVLQIITEDEIEVYKTNIRPIAVMIDNHKDAWPQAGLNDAYAVYEIIVEGGETRMMALFKEKDVEKIGPVRSSRHYFLDYALENDAIYVHWGYSDQAKQDIERLGIDNINGLYYENSYFYRDNSLNVSLEHTGYTNMELIKKGISKFGYRNTSNKKLLLDYSIEPIEINQFDGAITAKDIDLKYSGVVTTSYKYDEASGNYLRYVNGKEHKDYATKEQYTAKNIIAYQVSNHTLNGDVKGRQDIDNVGSGKGYFISNGYAVPISWNKSSRSAQTIYTLKDGTELKVNDGNTFIQIVPMSGNISIS